MLTVGIIGAGRVADVHAHAISEIPDIDMTGVFDIDADRSQKRAVEWGVRHYDDVDELITSPDNQALLVLTHVDSHLEIANRAIAAGKHVFIEKPVGRNPADIRATADLAARHGVVAMPGHNYAYLPEFFRMKRLVDAGDLGELRALFINYVIKHPEEVAKDYSGVMEEVMIHHTYLSLALLGAPRRVIAGATENGWQHHTEEDQAWMTFDYGRASAHGFCTFGVDDYSSSPWSFVVKLLGTEGTATVDFRTAIFKRPLGTLNEAFVPYEESYRNELESFARAIEGREIPISSMEDAAVAAGVIASAQQARSEGRFVVREDTGGTRW
ncbi:Gfo/Idh/MocA family oxidoreductase [Gordonia sp. LSe1-13]|uniref:Gfo/Idh/MocA family oxidoreductase n=1 Tax=Gordonia sesuvii TaxID=3116777 RepID=A0ABU7M994_9ACTN|nr:Gfo/Idh/MocA family oxidoreductase [Gordonia sp. LSe1-13]